MKAKVVFFIMMLALGMAWKSSSIALAEEGKAASTSEGEYEIDYEEEPGTETETEAVEEVPVVKPQKGKKKIQAPGGGSGGIQGSRAKHRFTPILKSETKSIYQKDGKALDVDSD